MNKKFTHCVKYFLHMKYIPFGRFIATRSFVWISNPAAGALSFRFPNCAPHSKFTYLSGVFDRMTELFLKSSRLENGSRAYLPQLRKEASAPQQPFYAQRRAHAI